MLDKQNTACLFARQSRVGQADAGQGGQRRQNLQLAVVREPVAGQIQHGQRGQVRRQVRQRPQAVARQAEPPQLPLAWSALFFFFDVGTA